MAETKRRVTGGVDTHKDRHCAAVVDKLGTRIDHCFFAADKEGYGALIDWLGSFGEIVAIGIEGTGSYGAGLSSYAQTLGLDVFEVIKPNKDERRKRGKDDVSDAYQAALGVLNGRNGARAKERDGLVEALRLLKTTYDGAVKSRTATINQMHNALLGLDDDLRQRLGRLTNAERVKVCAAYRISPRPDKTSSDYAKMTLRSLAQSIQSLDKTIATLRHELDVLVRRLAPSTVDLPGVGTQCAAQLLLAAGQNIGRLDTEGRFSMLCGASPIPASSGKTNRHRLNRAGDRKANSALYIIAIVRLKNCERTKTYRDKKLAEGKTKKDVIRCLKRYIAREVYGTLCRDLALLDAS